MAADASGDSVTGADKPFDVPISRANNADGKWLVLDSRHTCTGLFGCELDLHSSIQGVEMKQWIRPALRQYFEERHHISQVVRFVVHLDGGGPRVHRRHGQLPATWAVLITTEAADRTRAFYGYCCGTVVTDPLLSGFAGAVAESSTSGEIMAQVMGAIVIMHLTSDEKDARPIDVIFDNKTASRAARAHGMAKRHPLLSATAASLWQILSMRREVRWYHAFSHCGEVLNELVDDLVAHGAIHAWPRQSKEIAVSEWCRHYTVDDIKLLYLVMLPEHLTAMYPRIGLDRTAIQATPSGTVKWGLAAETIAKTVDHIPTKAGSDDGWHPKHVWMMQYNPGTARGAGTATSWHQQFTALQAAAVGVEEARDKHAFEKMFAEEWWVVASACTACGLSGCQLWISLKIPWAADCNGVLVFPQQQDIHVLESTPRRLVVRMELPVFSVLFVVAYGHYQAGHDVGVVCGFWKETGQQVCRLRRKGEHVVCLCDGNAHLHAGNEIERVHADHMREALEKMELCSNIAEKSFETYCMSNGDYVQNDYIATSGGISVDLGSMVVPDFAHSALGGFHEPLMARLQISPAPVSIAGSRRHAQFDRKALQEPAVQARVRVRLAELSTPSRYVEQTTRSHMLSSAIHGILCEEAPKPRKVMRKSWISDDTKAAICMRDEQFRRSRRLGRGIQRCHQEIAKAGGRVDEGVPVSFRTPLVKLTMGQLYDRALSIRNEKLFVESVLEGSRHLVKSLVERDRVAYAVTTSLRVSSTAIDGMCTELHRAIKPLKANRKTGQILVKDVRGEQTGCRAEQAHAYLEYLGIRCRGHMTSLKEHIEKSRTRVRMGANVELSSSAVVGALDFRQQSAVAPTGKGMGTSMVPTELFNIAAAEMTRLWDPICVEGSLTLDLPIQFQGGDNMMLIKSQLKPAYALTNKREILLADQEPKIMGGVVRKKLHKSFSGTMTASQWGDGFGSASCELAHVTVQAFGAIGAAMEKTVARVYIDVVQAYASIVTALTIPLEDNVETARALLAEGGFSAADIDEIFRDGANQLEWDNTPEHLRCVVAAFQEAQWIAADYADQILVPKIGTSAGVPLAGLVACAALSQCTRRIKCRLKEAGLVCEFDCSRAHSRLDPGDALEWEAGTDLCNVGIVDDDVFVALVDANAATGAAAHMASVIFEEYKRCGLCLHLTRAKTSAIISWHGHGKQEAKQDCDDLVSSVGGLPFKAFGVQLFLPVDVKYKHVGHWARADMKCNTDMVTKAASIRVAGLKLKKGVLANADIDVKTRLSVVATHVFPTGEYGAGSWTSISAAELSIYHRAIVDTYRIVDGSSRMSPEAAKAAGVVVKCDDAVLRDVGAMLPLHRLAYFRIRLFTLILQRRDTRILTVLEAGYKADKSWLKCVFADLAWVAASVSQFREFHEAAESRWVQYLVEYPKHALEAIKEAMIRIAAAKASFPVCIPAVAAPAVGELWTCGVCGSAKASI